MFTGGGATIRGAREPYFDKFTGFGSKPPKGESTEGSVAMMVDGSVRFLSKDIDPQVLRAMCTIHGADSVDLDKAGKVLKGFPVGSGPARVPRPTRSAQPGRR